MTENIENYELQDFNWYGFLLLYTVTSNLNEKNSDSFLKLFAFVSDVMVSGCAA